MATNKIILIRNAKQYDFGGGERFPVFIADILSRKNYIPIIISRSRKLLEFADSYNISTIKGPWWSHQNWSGMFIALTPIYIIWQAYLSIWYLVTFAIQQPFAIHIQSKDDFIAATIAGRLLGKRVVWTDHADLKHVWNNLTIWYKNPIGKLVYIAALLAHNVTVVSNSELQLISANLRKKSPIKSKLQVVYNGVLDTANQFTNNKLLDGSPLTFCVASRLVVDKGIREVIESFQELQAELPNSQLLLMGDGPDAGLFQEIAKNTPSIKFLGHQDEPLKIMAKADIFVHPTYHEGFSVALVEAGMLGLPIIATRIGGNVEIIDDNKTGVLVPIRDIPALTSAMRQLAKDGDLRQNIGSAARRQYLEKFQFDHIVARSFIPLYTGEKA